MDPDEAVTLFLCGDVMTGRGIDQVLPHSNDPVLYESYVKDARRYVELAEEENGPIPDRVEHADPWGDALAELERVQPAARIVNLETSVTTHDEPFPKGINYRMHPKNVPCLTALGTDCCALANNHVLDWGRAGLVETLDSLAAAGMSVAGAGRGLEAAQAPAVIETGAGRVLVFSFGFPSSGIPREWAAADDAPGVFWLREPSSRSAERVASVIARHRRQSDLVVASVHWGGNWGYEIPDEQRAFAHALIDRAGVHVVHGHSSHHPKAIEVHGGQPILYGCGDFLNDYEGISGHERFRPELALMYFPAFHPEGGELVSLEMMPMRIERFRLQRGGDDAVDWLAARLDRECGRFDAGVERAGDRLALRWRA